MKLRFFAVFGIFFAQLSAVAHDLYIKTLRGEERAAHLREVSIPRIWPLKWSI